MKTRQPRVLIVEAYSHNKVLENLYWLLNKRCDLSFLVNQGASQSQNFLFPSANKAKLIVTKVHAPTIFVWLLFYGRRFDYINISTGPEGSHFSQIVNILSFYFCCRFYREKIILTVKRINPYLKSSGGLFSYIRNKSIKYLKRFTFETQTMRRIFSRIAGVHHSPLGVSYDRYSDLLSPVLRDVKEVDISGRIRIGLLGILNPERRDYELIIRVLTQLSSKQRSKLLFVTLGGVLGGAHHKVVRSISRYAEVDWIDGWVSAEDFDRRGASCHLLLSPLREGKYGKFNGSGSFGDTIYLRKRIILPLSADKDREFDEVSIYYRNSDELLAIFKNLEELSMAKLNPGFFERFTTENVFKKLVKDLRLCP